MNTLFCVVCGIPLTGKHRKYCCVSHQKLDRKKIAPGFTWKSCAKNLNAVLSEDQNKPYRYFVWTSNKG